MAHGHIQMASARSETLDQLKRGVDILVIGGGITGAGIALDAATRGLTVGLVDADDFARGTSSRSSRLIHGGLRYLYNLDFPLVQESLRERGRLLTAIAPHLVTAQPFLWPLRTPVVERAYSAVGVGMYDALSFIGLRRRTVPFQKHLSKRGTIAQFPDVREHSLIGSIRFFDARADDCRLVTTIIRTAEKYGATVAPRVKVTGIHRSVNGKVTGAVVVDQETGESFTIPATHTIGAVGVWTEELQRMAGSAGPLKVLASKGIHIVVPRDRIRGNSGMFLRTEKSVLFIIPWPDHWIIGTTDTPWAQSFEEPLATSADVDYLLDHANAVLTSQLTREDIVSVYAGLRPLLQPVAKTGGSTAKISREHTVAAVADGMSVIAGGKLTTYRVMAADAVDFALRNVPDAPPSVTATTPLLGANGLDATRRVMHARAASYGWDSRRVDRLLSRYGSLIGELIALIKQDPALGEPLENAPQYLRAEVIYAVEKEYALHLGDVLERRMRLTVESADRGLSAAREVAELMAGPLGWTPDMVDAEVDSWRRECAAHDAALETDSDAEASSVFDAVNAPGGDSRE